MPIFEVEANGKTYEVEAPDMMTAGKAFQSYSPDGGTLAGAGKAIASGIGTGLTQFGGMGGDARNLVGDASEYLMGKITSPERAAEMRKTSGPILDTAMRMSSPFFAGPTSKEVKDTVRPITGEFYEPQTTPEKYMNRIGEFLPATLAGGGGVLRNLLQFGVLPAVASEYAGQKTEGTALEPYARAGSALLGAGAGVGVGKLINGAGNYMNARTAAQGIGDVLDTSVPTGAVRRMADSVKADGITPASMAARSAELGPEAMFMDQGRQLGGRAEAIASQPGRGQNTILNAVEGRTGTFGDATAERVKATLDKTMGASPNVVEMTKRVESLIDNVAGPAYKKVMDAHPVVNVPADITTRPAVAQAMNDAVSLAKNHGEKLVSPKETKTILQGDGFHIADDVQEAAKTSLKYWDYVKKSLDARINGLMKKGGLEDLGSKEKADLGGLMDAKRALVSHLDEVTDGAYANARKISSTKFELREAADFGRSALNNKLLPEEFAAQMAEMSLPSQAMAKTHMRREVDRLIDSARNDGAAARRILDTNNNVAKIEAAFGTKAMDEIGRRIAAETHFQDMTNKIAGNSRTAVRQELRKDTETPSTNAAFSTSLTGLAHAAGRGGLNYMREQGMTRTRDAMADMLTSAGPQAEKVAAFIAEFNRRKLSLSPGSLNSGAANGLLTSQQPRK